MSDEKLYSCMLRCSSRDKSLLMDDCKEEFLSYHPELRGYPISQGFMLRRVIEYYLHRRPFSSDTK